MTPAATVVVVLSPLIAWRLYSRFKRLVGRQESKLWRHRAAAIVFPILIALIGVSAMQHPLALAGLLGGGAAGVALGMVGLRLTRFEKDGEKFFYTPNAHLGIVLSLLLVGRIAYRLYEVSQAGGNGAPPDMGSSPLTLVIFGMLAGYYASYAIGLLRWRGKN